VSSLRQLLAQHSIVVTQRIALDVHPLQPPRWHVIPVPVLVIAALPGKGRPGMQNTAVVKCHALSGLGVDGERQVGPSEQVGERSQGVMELGKALRPERVEELRCLERGRVINRVDGAPLSPVLVVLAELDCRTLPSAPVTAVTVLERDWQCRECLIGARIRLLEQLGGTERVDKIPFAAFERRVSVEAMEKLVPRRALIVPLKTGRV
jgi:hypothetical protein